MRAEAVLLGALVACACAGSPDDMRGGEVVGDGLAATMEVKLESDSVQFVLHVTNTGDEAVDFTFPTSQRYDFVVRDEAGAEVWRWSEGMMFLQAISHAPLASGETWSFEAGWESGNRAGRFEVVGELTARDRDVRQSATFELP